MRRFAWIALVLWLLCGVGTAEGTDGLTEAGLCEWLDGHTKYEENGFAIDISESAELLDAYIRVLSRDSDFDAFDVMSGHLCGRYAEKFGREFLFGDECVADEIEYHVCGYLALLGYEGYEEPLTAAMYRRLYSEEELRSHYELVEIYTDSVNDPVQALVFGYWFGIRDCYVGTEDDPFREIR